jgi:hypothetical protein
MHLIRSDRAGSLATNVERESCRSRPGGSHFPARRAKWLMRSGGDTDTTRCASLCLALRDPYKSWKTQVK